MKILVPISKVPDTTSKIAFTDNNSRFNADGVTFILNPTDEWYALVRAIELKEKLGGQVTVINMGAADNEPIIRKALAIGADDAVRIDGDPADAFQIAFNIAAYAKSENYELVICGKETIDHNGGSVPSLIAGFLQYAFIGLVSKFELENGIAKAEREIEGGVEVVETGLPLVISAQKGIAEQRIPNMKGIMASRTKPIKAVPASGDMLTEVVNFELPPAKTGCKFIEPGNEAELIKLLHEEAKVI